MLHTCFEMFDSPQTTSQRRSNMWKALQLCTVAAPTSSILSLCGHSVCVCVWLVNSCRATCSDRNCILVYKANKTGRRWLRMSCGQFNGDISQAAAVLTWNLLFLAANCLTDYFCCCCCCFCLSSMSLLSWYWQKTIKKKKWSVHIVDKQTRVEKDPDVCFALLIQDKKTKH